MAARSPRSAFLLAITLGLVLATSPTPSVSAAAPTWREPQALNITDIAGQVPDWVLYDNVIAYNGSAGVAQFVSSERVGTKLRITVRLRSRRVWAGDRWWTYANMLGQRPMYDHMGSISPVSWLRLYDGSRDITNEIRWANYMEPAAQLPEASAAAYERYPSLKRTIYAGTSALPMETDGLRLPANWGGDFTVFDDYPELTGVFTIIPTSAPHVSWVESQEVTFQSYVGPGNVGRFQPLMNQLTSRYELRHPRLDINTPAGANYVMFTYPLMPFDVYDYQGDNLHRPIAGTVRLAPDQAMLSQDLAHGGAFPLQAAWQDADQSAGPYLSLLPAINRLTPPEYVVPANAPYSDCYLNGNCSEAQLQSLYDATMSLRIIYLSVVPRHGGLQIVPLRVADDTWWTGYGAMAAHDCGASYQAQAALPFQSARAWLPVVSAIRLPEERPVGYFDTTTQRMIGYLP